MFIYKLQSEIETKNCIVKALLLMPSLDLTHSVKLKRHNLGRQTKAHTYGFFLRF